MTKTYLPNPRFDFRPNIYRLPRNTSATSFDKKKLPNTHEDQSLKIYLSAFALLSKKQLKELCEDYNLVTGGQKEDLISRLQTFVETFSDKEESEMFLFSKKIKNLLTKGNITEMCSKPAAENKLLPPGIADKFNNSSPSILFELTNIQPPFGVHFVKSTLPFKSQFQYTRRKDCVPVLQISALQSELKSATVQINDVVYKLNQDISWVSVPPSKSNEYVFCISDVEPAVPLLVAIRIFRKVEISKIIDHVLSQPPAPNTFVRALNSLVCSITDKIIQIPCRSVQCLHPECFDLSGVLTIFSTYSKNQMQCPLCQSVFTAEELRYDPNFFSLVV